MYRRLHVLGFGVFLTLALGFLSAARPFVGYQGALIAPHASLQKMKDGTAHQPYVRRRLVPLVVRSVDKVIPPATRTSINGVIASIAPLKPFLLERSAVVQKADEVDGVVCLAIWLISFTIFVRTLESEIRHYLNSPYLNYPYPPWLPVFVTGLACFTVLLFLHNNFVYDPVTLACSALIIPVLRKQRILPLILLTAVFSFNRETAFVVPGFAFFYWMYRMKPLRALSDGLTLTVIYFVISGGIAYYYRHNPGWAAIYNLPGNLHAYSHAFLPHMLVFVLLLSVYCFGVYFYWRSIPAELKAVQWFILPWIAMHLVWGWMLEWRVFFEILPGMVLTSVVVWASFSRRRRALDIHDYVLWSGTPLEGIAAD